jgi:hypothetical protein
MQHLDHIILCQISLTPFGIPMYPYYTDLLLQSQADFDSFSPIFSLLCHKLLFMCAAFRYFNQIVILLTDKMPKASARTPQRPSPALRMETRGESWYDGKNRKRQGFGVAWRRLPAAENGRFAARHQTQEEKRMQT